MMEGWWQCWRAGGNGDGDAIMEKVGDGRVIIVTGDCDCDDGGGGSGNVNGGGRSAIGCTAVIMVCLLL